MNLRMYVNAHTPFQILLSQVKSPSPLHILLPPCPMGGGVVVVVEKDAKPSESLLTKWPKSSKGNYSTMMHSFSTEDTITVQHMEWNARCVMHTERILPLPPQNAATQLLNGEKSIINNIHDGGF